MIQHRKCLTHSVVFALLLLIASAPAAHAYIDPGTGSYVIQLLIAALAGIAVAIKIYWSKIKGFFSRSSSETQDTGSDGE
jgi:hypothetical protein